MEDKNNIPQDFETGGTSEPQPPVTPAQPAQPAAPAQPAPPAPPAQPAPPVQPATTAQPTTPAPAKPGQPAQAIKKEDKSMGKKFAIGLLIAFGVGLIILVAVVFIFVAGPQQEGVNPIAKALGIDPGQFINALVMLMHIFFGLVAFTSFILTMIGIFKASMAKKDDKVTKRKGAITALIAGVLLILTLFAWASAYYYFSDKLVERKPEAILPPVITEPASLLGLTAPITIEFDASNAPINRSKYEVISYEWDFGDGSTATSSKVSHTYKNKGANQGKYEVGLEIHILDRKTAEELVEPYKLLVSIANEKVSAEFEASPEGGEAPLTVKFDASKSEDPDGEIIRYDWDFDGDESFDDAEGIKVEHDFAKIGTYIVRLRVTDNNSEYNIGEKEIIVKAPTEIQAVIAVEPDTEKFTTGQEYIFSAAKSVSPNGPIDKYEWDFGDGTAKGKTKTVAHTFKKSGNYEVTLIATDEEGEEGQTYLEIEVRGPQSAPKAAFTTNPAQGDGAYLEGEVPFDIAFDASGTTDSDDNIVEYEWDFDGDNVSDAVGIERTYTFIETGRYNVTLTVIDADSNVSTKTITVKVIEQGIKADLKANKVTGSTPLSVTFDANGSTYPDGEIISYEWDFGDGGNSRLGESSTTHKYTKVGVFTAKVTVIASDGSRAEKELLVTVKPVALQSCFEVSKSSGPAPLIVIFDPSCSEGTITKYMWDFGDDQTSVKNKPTHTFAEPGEYPVSLEVTDNNDTVDVFEEIITVTD